MLVDHFPPFGLRLRTPRLELRLPNPEQLAELAELAVEGIHEPDMMPFLTPWTRDEPGAVARSVLQYHWKKLATWSPTNWTLALSVSHDGVVIGTQAIGATNLAVRREVQTGSWLGLRHHGRGFGTEMRAAVLELAFVGLDVDDAVSYAFEYNKASRAVSRKLGYAADGIERQVADGKLAIDSRMRLTRAAWEQHRTVEVTIEGLDDCRAMFGLVTTIGN